MSIKRTSYLNAFFHSMINDSFLLPKIYILCKAFYVMKFKSYHGNKSSYRFLKLCNFLLWNSLIQSNINNKNTLIGKVPKKSCA